MRIPSVPRIFGGILLLCVGIALFPAYEHWVATRTWVAVDMPISLAPGRVRTGNFHVNVSAVYSVYIDLNGYDHPGDPSCQEYEVLQAHWRLSRNGRVVSTWEDYWGGYYRTGTELGEFDSSSGAYDLEVEILPGATCLQKFQPRLVIRADAEDYVRGGSIYAMALLASCGLIGAGLGFLAVTFVGSMHRPRVPSGESLAIFDRLHIQREAAQSKLHLMRRMLTVPTVGYVYAIASSLFLLIYVPFCANSPWAYGIPVRLLRPGTIHARMDWQQPALLVYVDGNGNLYLNSKRVTEQELPQALEAEFARRADWSVYVDGDSSAEFADVARAMSLVRMAQGKVILVTPSLRAEAQSRPNRVTSSRSSGRP
jgi:biopolymer transport protein ExbD